MHFSRSLIGVAAFSFSWNLVSAGLPSTDEIRAELGAKLSATASIYDNQSPEFGSATARWELYSAPKISLVVDVHTEDDVIATILFANNHSVPFLASNGGHGSVGSLAALQNGIQIRLRSMNRITVSDDGKYAVMQGGVINLEVIQALDKASKQSTTGVCECTGFVGATLGGGHGLHQGQYGLMTDNLIDVRLVLANGTAVNVSASTYPDLFWGLRGAGHNFGVVTEVRYKIYDKAPADSWYTETLIFSKDKLEAVYKQLNTMMAGTPPMELSSYTSILRIAAIDPINPLIILGFLYHGPESEAKTYTAPFITLGPLNTNVTIASNTALPAVTANDINSEICQKGLNRLKFPVGLQRYDVPTISKLYDLYQNFSATPAFQGTQLLFEAYSITAVAAVDEKSTAFPHRGDKIIATPVISFKPDASLNDKAVRFGADVRAQLQNGSSEREQHAYVNYAHGDEELKHIYGYDVWRRTKLRALKKEFDASNRFNWYAPITFDRWG